MLFRSDLPGVVLCSALERLLNHYAVAPQGKLVVLAGNDQAWLTALTASEAGLSVAAVVDLREAPTDSTLLSEAEARGISVHMGATVYAARRDAESQSLCSVDIHRIDTQGEVGDLIAQTDCAVLAMSAGFMPAYQLACQAGAKLDYDDDHAAFTLTGQIGRAHV